MKTFLKALGVRIVALVLALAFVLGLAGFAIGRVQASAPAQGMVGTATPMPPMPGMPGMGVTATAVPANVQPAGSDVDALMMQMQQMMQSLQGVMGQLEQKSIVTPTPIPAPALDMQAIMTELQDINRIVGPLMLRIQADLQGTPSADELVSVRTQVEQVSARMMALMTQIQAARGNAAPAAPVAVVPTTMPFMPGMTPAQPPANTNPAAGSSQNPPQIVMSNLAQMLQQMQGLLQQMQNQQMQPGSMPGGQSGQMGSMPGMATPYPMPGMGAMPGMGSAPAPAMPGMSGSGAPMDNMMSMMDQMMSMMDSMMGTMNSMPGMAPTAPMPGMGSMSATPMPGMSSSGGSMDSMMMMMDQMMSMMDQMMSIMNQMMSMPDM